VGWLKHLVKRALAVRGYRLESGKPEPPREIGNLRHLALAYEHLLNETAGSEVVPADERRPEILGRLLGTPPPEAYAIVQALARTAEIDGDVCEFGVAQGETSALIANEIRRGSRRLHLFDSFEGLPPPTGRDSLTHDIFSLGSIEAYAGAMACPEDQVQARLADVGFPRDRFTIHRGFIEELIHRDRNLPSRVSFAYVDFDFYEPIAIALDYLHQVTRPGAIVIVDDYDFFSTGSKSAVDEFVARHSAQREHYSLRISPPALGYFAELERIA